MQSVSRHRSRGRRRARANTRPLFAGRLLLYLAVLAALKVL